MAKQFEEVQDDLVQMLRDSPIPTVFEVAIPDGYILPRDGLLHLPYAIISFGGQSPVALRNKGITNSRDDVKWTSVAIECVGNSPKDVRTCTGIVRRLFEGFSPDESWGELEETLAGDYTVLKPDYDLWPVRYATSIIFNTHTNASSDVG